MVLIVPTQPSFKLEDVFVGLILEELKIMPVDRRRYIDYKKISLYFLL